MMPASYSTEVYICVDVETAGPIPPDYSLLSIGACTVFEPLSTFYIELKPVTQQSVPEAAEVHKLSIERLAKEGTPPLTSMQRFEHWLMEMSGANKQLVFVAFNAPFDWMFINYYFIHYLGHNPFGHAALDIKALYMGQAGVAWSQTSWRFISPQLSEDTHLTHHALQDALDQAALFKKLLARINTQQIPGVDHP
jgi:DNA polymerase III epsilon subunit-like protein